MADFNNGKIDTKSNLIKEFTQINELKICKKNDYYSLGAILYKVLVGQTPTHKIAKQINEQKLHEQSPNGNVYEVPFFVKHKILSNEMSMILVKLLHEDPDHRFKDLSEIKQSLLRLRKNIFETPKLLRIALRHPVLPGETLEPLENQAVVDFRGNDMNKFSLKYLAKFICEYEMESVCINGSIDRPMPIRAI